MPNEYNLATPLANNPNMQALVKVMREEIEQIDLTRFLVFLFETVDEELLDLLAAQFDMLGFNGWILADTVQAKRELLKGAFELHALKGTPGGIKEVIGRLGFLGARIEEGWANFTDGSPEPNLNSWAYFRVIYDVPENRSIDPQVYLNLKGLIENYKNARSVLTDISLNFPLKDPFIMVGKVTMNVYRVSDNELLSTEVITNWIHPAKLRHIFNAVKFMSVPDVAWVPLYRFRKIAFGTSPTVAKPGVFQPDLNITNAFTKELSPNPQAGDSNGNDNSQIRLAGAAADTGHDAVVLRHFFKLDAGEANGLNIREMGLVLKRESGPDLLEPEEQYFSRVVRSSLVKTADIRIEGYWDIEAYPNVVAE